MDAGLETWVPAANESWQVTPCGTVERPGLLKMCVVPKVEKSFQNINQAFCLKMYCC